MQPLSLTPTVGPPNRPTKYITIFALHGVEFTAREPSVYNAQGSSFSNYPKAVFQKVQALVSPANLRIVAINRRNYGGSTPFSDDELDVIHGGTKDQKTYFTRSRGLEILVFIDNFIQRFGLPKMSPDRKTGGLALLGWSLGTQIVVPSIAYLDELPAESQARIGSRLRALILQGISRVSLS